MYQIQWIWYKGTLYLPLARDAVVGVMAAVDIPFGAARAVTACGTCARVTGAR